MEHAARAWWWAGSSGLLAALACCVPAVSAGSSAKMMVSEGQQHLQQSWAKLDAEARNHATNVNTVAHAFLEMGATPEQHSNLVVHSLGAATATVGQSQDPNAM